MIRLPPELPPRGFFAEMDVDSSKSPLDPLNSFYSSFPEWMDRYALFL
jgi:hypothetical protein